MRLFRHLFALWFVVAGTAAAQTPSDAISNGGFEAVFRISGKAGYPVPAAGALIEAHAAGHVTTTLAGADGRYTVAIEQRHLPASAIVELVAFDRTDATKVWAGAPGPASRLYTLGGAAASIDASHDPFVNLGPYSTAVAGALRGYNGFAPITDAATFERAARTIDPRSDLVYGLALIARGDITLPPGADNTFGAVLAGAPARAVTATVNDLNSNGGACTSTAVSSYCAVALTLPLDPDFIPSRSVRTGVVHVPYAGHQSALENMVPAYRLDGATGSVWYFDQQIAQLVVVTDEDATTGTKRLARQDGQPLLRTESFDFVQAAGGQIRAWHDTTALRVRATAGPGGITWHATAPRWHVSYPDNPEIAPFDEVVFIGMPQNVFGGSTPASAVPSLPNFANDTWLLPLPSDLGTPADSYYSRFGYDVHVFGTSTGTARRSGATYTWSSNGTGRVTFAYGTTSATLDFVNEEEPGVWRVIMRMTASGYDLFLNGLAMRADASGWSAASPPGTYEATINGYACAGPYGGLVEGLCPLFGWTFHPGGNVDQIYDEDVYPWGTWSLATAPHGGKLRFERLVGNPAYVNQRRGWERIRHAGDKGYILENVTLGTVASPAAVITFGPTSRLTRIAE